MKTKLLVTIVFLTLSWNSVYSQLYRYADLHVRFTSPAQNSHFKSPSVINFEFQIVNQGPDTIFNTDTLFYTPSHSYSGWSNERKQVFYKTVPPNDSIEFADTIKMDSREFKDTFQLSFNQVPMAYGPDKGKLRLQNEFSQDRSDNNDNVKLFHLGNLSSRVKYQNRTNIYPNPITDNRFFISNPKGLESLKVLNEISQEMSIEVVQTNDEFVEVDVHNLSSGIYFLYIKSENKITVEKLIIQ